MKEANCPLCFWDYCLEHRVQIYNLTSHDHIKFVEAIPIWNLAVSKDIFPIYVNSDGTTGAIFGITRPLFPHNQEVLGCVLGPARGEGNELSQWVLKFHSGITSC